MTRSVPPAAIRSARRQTLAQLPIFLRLRSVIKKIGERIAALVPYRRFWRKLADVTFISQSEEDDRLAAIERRARESLVERNAAAERSAGRAQD